MDSLIFALGGLQSTLITQYIGPIALVIIAGVAIVLLIKRQIAMALSFGAVALIAAFFIYAGPVLFGQNGVGEKVGTKIGNQINTVEVVEAPAADADFVALP